MILNLKKWRIHCAFFLFVIGIGLLLYGGGELFRIMKPSINVKTIDQVKSLKKGDTVKFDITMIDSEGYIKEFYKHEGETNTDSQDSARYYFVPFYDLDKQDQYMLTIKLNSDDFENADKAIDAYNDFKKTNKIPTQVIFSIHGVVNNMDKEKNYVRIMKEHVGTIYVTKLNKKNALIGTGVGLVVIVIGIVLALQYIKNKKKEKETNSKFNNQSPQNLV